MPTARPDTASITSGADLWAGRDGPIPSWVPAAGEMATLTVANGGLANNFRDVVSPDYASFYSATIVNDYSGSIVNPYHGPFGAIVFHGAGHAASNDTSVMMLELGFANLTWVRRTDPPDFFSFDGTGNNIGNPNISSDWGEYDDIDKDGNTGGGLTTPASRHSYGDFAIIGPNEGGAAYGTLYSVQPSSLGQAGVVLANNRHAAHKLPFTAKTGMMTWARGGQDTTNYGNGHSVVWSAHVVAQNRIYTESQGNTHAPRWYVPGSEAYVYGTGTARTNNHGGADGGTMFEVPERNLVLHIAAYSGVLGIKYMDVSASDPSWVNALRTLSSSIPITNSWSCACWCPDSSRIIVGNINGADTTIAEIEIPASLSDTWSVTTHTVGITPNWGESTTYTKWQYNPLTKCIVYVPYVKQTTGDDQIYVYRPRNT